MADTAELLKRSHAGDKEAVSYTHLDVYKRQLHESAEGFSYMSKQGDSPDYECWQQLRECPAGAQQQPFERST